MSIVRVTPIGADKEFADFCRLPNTLMKIVGQDFVDEPRPGWQKWAMKMYSMVAFICNLYCCFFISKSMYLMALQGFPDLALSLRLISGFNYALFATVKFINFRWNIDDADNIYTRLKDIYPKSSKERRVYRVNQHFWPKWIQMVIYFYFGAVTFISISPLLEGIVLYGVEVFRVGFNDAEFGYFKLYEILYSFDHRTPWTYVITYCIELFHAQFVVIGNVCTDIWLLCYTMQLCMHFENLVKSMDQYVPDEQEPVKDNRFIAEFVKKHQVLLNIGDDVNAVFGVLMLLLLISTAATICCAGVYTLTQGFGRELVEYCAFLPTAIGQYFLICYYGQKLAGISENVAHAAYSHPWYNGSEPYKKSILIIMIRSQKAVQLNANGFKPICLEAFQMVMVESYRLFALLKQTMFE